MSLHPQADRGAAQVSEGFVVVVSPGGRHVLFVLRGDVREPLQVHLRYFHRFPIQLRFLERVQGVVGPDVRVFRFHYFVSLRFIFRGNEGGHKRSWLGQRVFPVVNVAWGLL